MSYGEGLACPVCRSVGLEVKDSRATACNDMIRRRRYCRKCDKRFTTFEIVVEGTGCVISQGAYNRPVVQPLAVFTKRLTDAISSGALRFIAEAVKEGSKDG